MEPTVSGSPNGHHKPQLLTRESILSVDDLQYALVDVPEWGGVVRVKGLTGDERDAFETSIIDTTGKKAKVKAEGVRAKLVALAIVDEVGKSIFSVADVVALGRKSAVALGRVYDVCSRLSGLTDRDVEELAKNSGSDRSGIGSLA